MATYSSSNDSTYLPFIISLLRLRAIHFCFVIALVIPSTSFAEWVEWIGDASIESQMVSNLNRSAFSVDEEDDISLSLDGIWGRAYQIDGNQRITLTTDLKADFFSDFNHLDSQQFGLSASFRQKLGTGLTKPWIKAKLNTRYLNVKDDIRSGLNLLADLQFGKRFSERLDFIIGLGYKSRDGKKAPSASPPIGGNVFDQENWELYTSTSYLLTERWLGSLGIAYMDGEIDSSCTDSNIALVLANERLKGIVDDEVFGGCVYRVDTSAQIYSLDASYALSSHDSINIGYQLQAAKTSYKSYKTTIISISYKYSY